MGTLRGYTWFATQRAAQDYADKLSAAYGYPQPGTDRYTDVLEHQGRRGLEYLVVLEDVPLWEKTGTFVDESGQERDKYESFRETNLADIDNSSTLTERTNRKSREQLESEGAFPTDAR